MNVDAFLGSRPVSAISRLALGGRLRVIAYHGVDDPLALRRQLEWILDRYEPVDQEAVARWAQRGGSLPKRAVWITFDDGRKDVVSVGQPVLDNLGVRATLFVCPGLLEEQRPYWWDVAAAADAMGIAVGLESTPRPAAATRALKLVSDVMRREIVQRLQDDLETRGVHVPARHATLPDLRRWVSSGHGIGNHTWDHPRLDRCDASAQRAQIGQAAGWITDHFADQSRVFAYPNGDHTVEAEAVLDDLGYDAGALFDHRLQRLQPDQPLRLSRLRLDSDAPLPRARAIVSGAHSLAFHLRPRHG